MAQTKNAPANKPGQPGPGTAAHQRSFMRNDFSFIRKAATAFAVGIAISASLVGGSKALLNKSLAAKNQMQEQRNEASNRYREAESEKQEIQNFQPKFIQLKERGFVGDERRLEWLESIQAIQKRHQLLPITFEIEAQRAFQIDPTVSTGEMELRGSKMSLHLELLHEMDLLVFLAELREKGFYNPQSCSIKRSDTNQEEPLSARLVADCSVYWLTMGQSTPPADGSSNAAQPGK